MLGTTQNTKKEDTIKRLYYIKIV